MLRCWCTKKKQAKNDNKPDYTYVMPPLQAWVQPGDNLPSELCVGCEAVTKPSFSTTSNFPGLAHKEYVYGGGSVLNGAKKQVTMAGIARKGYYHFVDPRSAPNSIVEDSKTAQSAEPETLRQSE